MPKSDCAAALLTGVYGAGKSTLIAEIATIFEERGEPFAAIDLDWLGWFDVGWDDDVREFAVVTENLRLVTGNFVTAGARRLVIAQSIEHERELDEIRSAVDMPLQVVLVEADIDTIERRTDADPTTGRRVDVSWARRWLADGIGSGFEDHRVSNDRDIRVVALEVLTLLGW